MNTCLVFRALTSRATCVIACSRVSVFFVIYSTQWINIIIGHKTDVSQFNSRPSLYSWTLLIAHSKGKLKTNVDKAFPCFSVKLSCYHQAGTKGEKTDLSYSFLTSALEGGEPGHALPWYLWIGGCVGLWTQRLVEKSFAFTKDPVCCQTLYWLSVPISFPCFIQC
jgi:hypothetical protein